MQRTEKQAIFEDHQFYRMDIVHSGDIVLENKHATRKFLVDMRYVPDNEPKPVVLFVHGFKGFKDWGPFNLMADYFARAGFVFVKMNFSHNGTTIDQPIDFVDLEAFGNNNFSLEQEDLQVVLDKITAGELVDLAETDVRNVYLIGHSRGGAASILTAAADERVKRLATLAAMNDLSSRYDVAVMKSWQEEGVMYVYNGRTDQQMPLYYQIVENYNENKEALHVPSAVEKLDKPFIAFHGNADETLPIAMLHQIKSWNKRVETIEMEGANHTFGSVHPYTGTALPNDLKSAIDQIIAFFKKEH